MALEARGKGVREREAGEYGQRILCRIGWRAVIAVAVLGFGTPLLGLLLGFHSATFAGVELVAIGGVLLIDRYVNPILDRRIRGIVGEKDVGQLLDDMRSDGWRMLHDVGTGRGNIDHVAVGPGGVLTIETKSRRGRVRVANIDPGWLKQAYAQKKFVERLLDLSRVDCLLVFSAAYLDLAVTSRCGVTVLPARMLQGHLRRRPIALGAEQIDQIYDKLVLALEALAAHV